MSLTFSVVTWNTYISKYMIESLTINKLIAYGFDNESIEHFKQWPNYEMMFFKTLNERYWSSNVEGKIYSGEDASRKYYFRNQDYIIFPADELSLLPEYFKLTRERFLNQRKKQAGSVFNEEKSKERFKELEIEKTALELDKLRQEIANPQSAPAKTGAQLRRTQLEIYMDWLTSMPKEVPEVKLIPSVAKYFKPIPQDIYFRAHINDQDTMDFYERVLKQADSRLSLTTNIYDLPDIFKINETWDRILTDRLKHAPDKSLATESFKQELLATLEYDDDAGNDSAVNKDKYFNRFRKIVYNYAIKGQAVTLQYLGYLILKYQCGTPEGVEIIEGFSNVFDVRRFIETFAEGAAAAIFLHKNLADKSGSDSAEKTLFKSEYDPRKYLDILKDQTYTILNERGEYIYGDRRKSAISAFFDLLEWKGIINHFNAKERADLINELIPQLNITDRTLQSKTGLFFTMRTHFETIIDSI